MTKKIFAILVALIMCLSMAVSAFAFTEQYIDDPDSNLTYEELSELNSYAEKLEVFSGFAIIFCIISDNDGMTNIEYAEDVYYSFTDSEQAVIFVHNYSEKVYEWLIIGDDEDVFTDNAVNAMKTAYDMSDSYFSGLMGFYAAAETILEGEPGETFPMGYEAPEDEGIIYTPGFISVERTLPLVVDNADLLSSEEEAEFIERCETFISEYQMELAILTVDDLEGKTAQEYADDFYDYNGYGYGESDDGMLVLYKPGEEGERELHITTHGRGSEVFFAGIREGIYAEMKDYLIADNYYGAFDIYLDKAETQLKPGVPVIWLFVFMLIGATVGLIVTTSMTSKNKTVVAQNNAKVYTRQGSMNITGSSDTFLYSFVSVKPRPKVDNGGSVSSTHTSSSGRTHGGTGGKF